MERVLEWEDRYAVPTVAIRSIIMKPLKQEIRMVDERNKFLSKEFMLDLRSVLEESGALEVLMLDDTRFSETGFMILLQGLRANRSLKHIYLRGARKDGWPVTIFGWRLGYSLRYNNNISSIRIEVAPNSFHLFCDRNYRNFMQFNFWNIKYRFMLEKYPLPYVVWKQILEKVYEYDKMREHPITDADGFLRHFYSMYPDENDPFFYDAPYFFFKKLLHSRCCECGSFMSECYDNVPMCPAGPRVNLEWFAETGPMEQVESDPSYIGNQVAEWNPAWLFHRDDNVGRKRPRFEIL
jgi:hypothetical protein